MSAIRIGELTVLVAEPSSIQRRIICNALRNNGVTQLREAENGASALAQLATQQPKLVISSMYLPDMTGTELVQQLRESPDYSDTPFMLISSETRFRYLEPIRQAGVVGILPKPFSDTQLRTALDAALDLLEEPDEDGGELHDYALRVLLVDDSLFSRKHIARILESLGIDQIDQAEDGVQALQLMRAHLYDFVVTDLNMPHMDGKELIDHIRHDTDQASLPILMVTSEASQNRLAAVQQSGVSAICDKPFEPSTIRKLVRNIVST